MQNKIYIGSLTNPSFVFTNNDLISVDGVNVVDLVGNELSIDELNPRVLHVMIWKLLHIQITTILKVRMDM